MTDGDRDESVRADRAELLELLEDGVREAHRKVTEGRVRDPEREKVRIQWVRALAYSAGQYRQLKNDEELDEMAERIEALESAASRSDQYRVK